MMKFFTQLSSYMITIFLVTNSSLAQPYEILINEVIINDRVEFSCRFTNSTNDTIVIPSLSKYWSVSDTVNFEHLQNSPFHYSLLFLEDNSKKSFGHLQHCNYLHKDYKAHIKCIFENRKDTSWHGFFCSRAMDTIPALSTKDFVVSFERPFFKCWARKPQKWRLNLVLSSRSLSFLNRRRFDNSISLSSNEVFLNYP